MDLQDLERRLIETKIQEQQKQGEENNAWLAGEESVQVRIWEDGAGGVGGTTRG